MTLEITGLTVSRGGGSVIRGLQLSLAAGGVLALVGKNGSGKSTLLETIAGLVRADKGSIRIGGKDCLGKKPHSLARLGIALVPEGRQLFPSMTVYENLALGCHNQPWFVAGPKKKCFTQVWDIFPILYEFRKRSVGNLSGGQQQMVTVGRALMSSPKILMLDEPTFGLSPQLTETMCDHLKNLQGAGMSLLLAEQNVDVALDVSPELAVLSGGEIAQAGTREQLFGSSVLREAMLGL